MDGWRFLEGNQWLTFRSKILDSLYATEDLKAFNYVNQDIILLLFFLIFRSYGIY